MAQFSAADPVVILSYARTPMGSMQGALSDAAATDLGATAVKAAVERAGVAGDKIDRVYMGCVLPAGLATKNGFTPLSVASHNGRLEVVKLLLRHHVNPLLKSTSPIDGKKFTAKRIAKICGHADIAALLSTVERMPAFNRVCVATDEDTTLVEYLRTTEGVGSKELDRALTAFPLPALPGPYAVVMALRRAALPWCIERHRAMWPPSFHDGARTVLLVGQRLQATLGSAAPPMVVWVDVLTYCGRDCFYPRCTGCGAFGEGVELKRCTGCGYAQFCDTACSRRSWAEHKAECKREQKRRKKKAAIMDRLEV